MKKIYNKLIRDKIPGIIESDNEIPEVRVLSKREFVVELKKKIVEESKELAEAQAKNDVLNEIIDITELLGWLAKIYKLRPTSIRNLQKEKNKKRGSFKKRLFLKYTKTKE